MIDEVLICDKFAEFSRMYENERIDDFNTFLMARVADHFMNTQGASTDEIYAAIKSALSDRSKNTEEKAPSVHPVEKQDRSRNDKNRNKPLLIGYVLIATVALVGITLMKRAKNKGGR